MENSAAKNEKREELTVLDAIYDRHSVRHYTEEIIEDDIREELNAAIAECNEHADLAMRAWYDDPVVFDCQASKIAKFKNVNNFIVLAGPAGPDLEERCGYYGELLVLKLQQMGLNSCWVGESYSKRSAQQLVHDGNRLVILIAFGYGETDGEPHSGKFLEEIVSVQGRMPKWFKTGAEAALLAPTAKCGQKFKVILGENEIPQIKLTKRGQFSRIELGIVKCHFELASGYKVAENK